MSKTPPTPRPRPSGKAPASATPPDPGTLRIDDDGTRSNARVLADCCVVPALHSAAVVQTFTPVAGPDLTELIGAIKERTGAVQDGNMKPVEAMLMGQAEALQAVFSSLAKRAANNMGGGYLQAAETYMKLALRAQSQSRATLETLAAIKNPSPVVIAKQANVAHGPQQVNNGAGLGPGSGESPVAAAPAREIESRRNELLEYTPCETLTPPPATAGRTNADADRLPASASGNPGKPLPAHAPR